jgi:hypothetical protein
MIDLKAYGRHAASTVYSAIQNAANGTERSKQQQDMYIGVSTLGHCRQYAALMMKQTPFSDVRDKTAAFMGTVLGDAIEAQLRIDHPGWLIQEKLTFPVEAELMDGGVVDGTCDILIPWEGSATVEEWEAAAADENYTGEPLYIQGIWDNKSKAELETIRKYGPSQQQIFQLHAYVKAAIKKGLLNPEHPIILGDVFFDRSGTVVMPYGVFHEYKEDVVVQINDWINDVIYAVINGEDAPRDKTRDWCHQWCEYATTCRGFDTDVTGLIENPEAIATIEKYAEWSEKETEAKNAKKALKKTLEGITPGSTGKYFFRRTFVNGGHVEYDQQPYEKIDIRKVPKPKGASLHIELRP